YDRHLIEWINHNIIFYLDNFFRFITDTAGAIAAAIAVLIIIYGFIKKNGFLKYRKYQVAFAFSINAIVINILKYSINRPRPFAVDKYIEKLTGAGSPSFPSGHTGDAMIVAISMCLLFARQTWLLAIIWIWAVAVAYSRMALGVHYPGDILGSVVISLIVAFASQKVFNKITISQNNK
ncbi:MAG: phosphatase PAP2 family protein, partial [Ginsengibacter sp.]